jgi:peroxiredoxin
MKIAGIVIAAMVAVGALVASFTTSQKAEATAYTIGDAVADFKLKNVDGKTLSLATYRPEAKGYIVVFTCNHCPFAKAYESRIMALDKKYAAQGYPLVTINSSDPAAYEEDSFENMKTRATERGYTFPYLVDETQQVARAFGATRTPTMFVVKKEGDKFTVQYIGAIDDNAQDTNGITKRYVEDAVNNLLAGKPVMTTVTKSVGCAIKWKDA